VLVVPAHILTQRLRALLASSARGERESGEVAVDAVAVALRSLSLSWPGSPFPTADGFHARAIHQLLMDD
jgi:hypothetical protein